MPSRNKVRKIVKLIKSVSPSIDLLTLPCEWRECEFVTDKMSIYIEHIANHLEVEDNVCMDANNLMSNLVFECRWRECGHEGAFSSFSELARHVYFHGFHAKLKSIGAALCSKNSLSSCLLDSSSRNMIPDLPDHLQCFWNRCQDYFDNPELYYVHVLQHSDVYPAGNDVSGGCACLWEGCSTVTKSKHRLKEHLRSHTQEKVIACSVCGGLFSNSTKLFDHIKRQAESDTHHYQCSHCNRRCSTERLLRDHMRQHVNHYRCPFCEKTCPNPSSLRTHVHYRHTETREYKCSQCDYCAKSAVDLRRHEDNHTRIWINCEVEGCKFHARYIWDMKLHCRIAHQNGNRTKYLCHVCGKKYSKALKLTAHLCGKHEFKKPSGHTRFRYKQHEDGFYRLLTIRYESVNMTEHAASKRHDSSVTTPESHECTPILIQPDCITETVATQIRIKQENNGLICLPDVDVVGGMIAPDEEYMVVEPDNHQTQTTYYVSSAIASAFQVCSAPDQENESNTPLYLLPNSTDGSSKMEVCSTTNNNCGTSGGNWSVVTSGAICNQNDSVYYVTLPKSVAVLTGDSVELTPSVVPTESHVLRVFQQDGVGTVVASDDHSSDTCKLNLEHVYQSEPLVESDHLGDGSDQPGGGQDYQSQSVVESDHLGRHIFMLMGVDNVVPNSDVTMETEQITVN